MTSNLCKNREGEGIPGCQQLILNNTFTITNMNVGAINNLVTRHLTTTIIDYGERAIPIHGDTLTLTAFHRLHVNVLDRAILTRLVLRRFFQPSCTADMEGTHGKLGAGLTDGLCSDNAYGLANFYWTARGKVTTITFDTAASPGLTGENRTDTDTLYA